MTRRLLAWPRAAASWRPGLSMPPGLYLTLVVGTASAALLAVGVLLSTAAVPLRWAWPVCGALLAAIVAVSWRASGHLVARTSSLAHRLATTLAVTTDALVVFDESGRVVLFNDAAERIFGRSRADVIDRRIEEIVPPGVRAGGSTLTRPDGTEALVELRVRRVAQGRDILHALVVADVTERHRAEEERSALREVTARHSAFLDEAGRLLSASLDPTSVLPRLAQRAADTVADWCLVDLVEADGTLLRVSAVRSGAIADAPPPPPQPRRVPSLTEPELVRKVLATQQLAVIAQATASDVDRVAYGPEETRLAGRLGARSLIVVPLVGLRRCLGAITLARSAGGAPADLDAGLATELARRVATAIDAGDLYRQAQEAQRQFAGLVEGLDAIVWEADPATLEVTFVNQHVRRLLGYSPQDWLAEGAAWLSLVHPDDQAGVAGRLRECGRTGRVGRIEYRVRAADGRILWLDTVVRLVREGGSPRLYGLTIDATERKRVEDERSRLLATEQGARAEAESVARRSRFLADACDLLVSSLDYEATLQSLARLAVPTFADWCLVQLADPHGGRRMHAACADADHAGLAAALETLSPAVNMNALAPVLEMFRRGEPLVVPEVETEWLDSLRLIETLGPRSIMVVPLVARDRTLGSLTFISTGPDRRYGPADLALAKDLAQRAAVAVDNAGLYRAAEEANRAKDEFLATVSHELRTPLTAMLGWVHMLRSERLSADQATQALDSIERNTRAQARLINDLLDISRVTAGKLPVDKRPLDLRGVVENAVESVRQDAEARRLTLACQIEPTAVRVLGDAVRLEQVILNLLANAVKFTPAGGRIDIGLERDQATARITVADTGQGIDPELLPHIFESFRQAESGSTRRHGGLGLGLAIVRHLVALHDGRVEARSPGKGAGATFAVRLPLLTGDHPPESVEVDRRRPGPPAELPRLEQLHALVVDDHEDTRQLVRTVLADCGAVVEVADSVEDAVGKLHQAPVDVVICDIEMPGLDGYALIPPLRTAERERGHRILAIALTAYASADDRARALAAGFDVHVAKPIGAIELADVVASAVASR